MQTIYERKPKTQRIRYHFQAPRVTWDCGTENYTNQADAASTDINNIVERFVRTGDLPIRKDIQPQYGDVTPFQGDLTENYLRSKEHTDAFAEFKKTYVPPGNTDVTPVVTNVPPVVTNVTSEPTP